MMIGQRNQKAKNFFDICHYFKSTAWDFLIYLEVTLFLPPAYVVWREGTVFTGVCLLTFRGGGVPGLRFSGGGGYPVLVKGKIFDSRFGLIHVQTGKKIFVEGTPPPAIARKLLWLHGGRYASCVHAGGLSCRIRFHSMYKNPKTLSCLFYILHLV